jgi:cytosine/adenosine deaminase-related metal-dependent hydrolase
MSLLTLRARYVFPVVGNPIPNGSVTIDGEQIAAVGQHRGEGQVRDLGNVAILPGLVNAHVHLEFSRLPSPLGQRGIGLVDWIRRLMAYRRTAQEVASGVIALGLQESIRHGVTTLGEIAQADWPIETLAELPIDATLFRELIAPTPERVAAAMESAQSHLRTCAAVATAHFRPGLSPHAPYSVHPDLLAAVVRLSAAEKIPVAMHLAESREEIELLQNGTGPLRAFLEELGAWNASLIRPSSRPIDYLRLLAAADRSLIIHGNYLDDEEIAFLGQNASRMAAVYCPRTHDWFAHDTYPLQKMLAAGITIALGTDGRGSSPDLSLLAEMRFAARQHPAVTPRQILHMGTLGGASALGCDREVGSIEPGKRADLTVVALPDHDAADPHELLFRSDEPVAGRYYRGAAYSSRSA